MEGFHALAHHLDCSYNQGGNLVGPTHPTDQKDPGGSGWHHRVPPAAHGNRERNENDGAKEFW
jgi:hypothetical protein